MRWFAIMVYGDGLRCDGLRSWSTATVHDAMVCDYGLRQQFTMRRFVIMVYGDGL